MLLTTTLVTASACSDSSNPVAPILTDEPDTLLSAERVRGLPVGQQRDWLVYLASSDEQRERDATRIQDELQSVGRLAWWPAPAGPDYRLTPEMTGEWFASAAARQLANVVVSFQTPSGGWSKAVAYVREREPGQSFASQPTWSWIATFDNGATTEQMRLLGGVIGAHNDTIHIGSFARGAQYIRNAQFPNGCWPQIYPLEGGYHDAITYNDNVAVRILRLLSAIETGMLPFVAAEERAIAKQTIDRAITCIVASQVVVSGQRTVWGQQHDPLTLAPVRGRSYEPAALCSLESAGIIDYLLEIPAPNASVVAAVHAAATWLKERAIYGYTYDPRGVLIASPGSGPLWARFYEIGTNRPLFSDRDGITRYALSEVSEERRGGYAWYVETPAATLARFDVWKRTHVSALE